MVFLDYLNVNVGNFFVTILYKVLMVSAIQVNTLDVIRGVIQLIVFISVPTMFDYYSKDMDWPLNWLMYILVPIILYAVSFLLTLWKYFEKCLNQKKSFKNIMKYAATTPICALVLSFLIKGNSLIYLAFVRYDDIGDKFGMPMLNSIPKGLIMIPGFILGHVISFLVNTFTMKC